MFSEEPHNGLNLKHTENLMCKIYQLTLDNVVQLINSTDRKTSTDAEIKVSRFVSEAKYSNDSLLFSLLPCFKLLHLTLIISLCVSSLF